MGGQSNSKGVPVYNTYSTYTGSVISVYKLHEWT